MQTLGVVATVEGSGILEIVSITIDATGAGAPVGGIGNVEGVILFARRGNNFTGGLSKIHNGMNGSDAGDTLNGVKDGFEMVLGEIRGERAYKVCDYLVSLDCLGKLPKDMSEYNDIYYAPRHLLRNMVP